MMITVAHSECPGVCLSASAAPPQCWQGEAYRQGGSGVVLVWCYMPICTWCASRRILNCLESTSSSRVRCAVLWGLTASAPACCDAAFVYTSTRGLAVRHRHRTLATACCGQLVGSWRSRPTATAAGARAVTPRSCCCTCKRTCTSTMTCKANPKVTVLQGAPALASQPGPFSINAAATRR